MFVRIRHGHVTFMSYTDTPSLSISPQSKYLACQGGYVRRCSCLSLCFNKLTPCFPHQCQSNALSSDPSCTQVCNWLLSFPVITLWAWCSFHCRSVCFLSLRVRMCVSFHPRQKHVISRAPVLLVDRYNIKSHKSECELRGDMGDANGRTVWRWQ